MKRMSPGISQIGGNYRTLKYLKKVVPPHEFFLSLFAGACWLELNKPRCRYECFNDIDAEFINYFLMIREQPEEFNQMKEGVFGLVSQEIFKRLMNGQIKPKNDLERAYFFFYLNHVAFGGNPLKDWRGILLPLSANNRDMEDIKANYRGIILPTSCKEKSINEVKSTFRTNTPKCGYKGINPKITRPSSSNDLGLLTPLDENAIKRLRYVNLTSYDFRKVYTLFHRAFYIKKGLERECFIYADPPYPGTEKYYQTGFGDKEHLDLMEMMLESPFNFLLQIGGECELYLDVLSEFHVLPIINKYSTAANDQVEVREYLIMNYDIKKTGVMKEPTTKLITDF